MTVGLFDGIPQRRAALFLHAMGEHDRAWVLGALPPALKDGLLPLLEELRALEVPPDPHWLASIDPALARHPGASTAHMGPSEPALLDAPVPLHPMQSPYGQSLPDHGLRSGTAVQGRAWEPSPVAARLHALGTAQVAQLARWLSQEPASLALRLLRMDDWPWREALLSQLPAAQQMRLRQELRADESTARDVATPTADAAAMGADANVTTNITRNATATATATALNRALLQAIDRRLAEAPAHGAVPPRGAVGRAVPASTDNPWKALWRGVARRWPGSAA